MKALTATVSIALVAMFAANAGAQRSVEKAPAELSIAQIIAGHTSADQNLFLPNSGPIEQEFAELTKPEVPAQPEVAPTKSAPTMTSTEPAVAQSESTATALEATAAKLVSDNASGSTEVLRTGAPLDMTATLGPQANPMDQQSVNVHVTYDARPVGGILNIRVELVPVFGGIGSAVRPTISREFAQAVDNFDDDFIGDTITKLTNEISTQLGAKE